MTDSKAGRVEREVHIDAPPETVFAFLVDARKMETWMGVEVSFEARPGGLFRVDVNGDDVARGRVLEVVPPRRVVYSWGWEGSRTVPPGSSRVEIVLTPEDGGTRLRLVHSGLPAPAADRHGEGWTHYVGRLCVAAGGGDPGPDPWAAKPGTEGA